MGERIRGGVLEKERKPGRESAEHTGADAEESLESSILRRRNSREPTVRMLSTGRSRDRPLMECDAAERQGGQ